MAVDDSFTFSSDAALNLHHLLYAEAWSIESAENGDPSKAQPAPADLALRDALGFSDAIAYYRAALIEGSLLFDDTLQDLARLLTGRGGAAQAGWARVFTPLLADYRVADWPEHDRQNKDWTAVVTDELEKLLPEILERLQQAYRRNLSDPPVLVSTVYVGDRLPAYTSLHPTHIICSSTHPHSQGLRAVEIVLHEASHALVDDLRESISRRVDVTQPGIGQLWHAVLFFITGQVVVRQLAESGVAYTPYLESTGLLDRAWPQFRQPITDAWTGYLTGQWGWDSACDRLAAGVSPAGRADARPGWSDRSRP